MSIDAEIMIDKDGVVTATFEVASVTLGESDLIRTSISLGSTKFTLFGVEGEAWVFLSSPKVFLIISTSSSLIFIIKLSIRK